MARSLSGYLRSKRSPDDSPARSSRLREVALKPTDAASPSCSPSTFAAAGIKAQYRPLPAESSFAYEWVGRCHYLALHDLHLKDGETFTDSHGADHRRDLRGTMTFIPAGCRMWGWSSLRSSSQSFTALYLDPRLVDEAVAQKLRQLPAAPYVYFDNLSLRSNLQKIQRMLSGKSACDALYLETLGLLCVLELCVTEKDKLAVAAHIPGRLPRAIVQRISDYVEANLGKDIGLNDLAALAGLSRFHFLRAFKISTQETPYQYLLRRRIEHSQTLLGNRSMTVAEVAMAVGFKDSARFIRAFRHQNGVTPGKYRD